MFETLEACISAWEQAGRHGDLQARIERNARWIPYYSYLAALWQDAEAAIDAHAAEVVDSLMHRSYLNVESSMLDIGAGTGTYALAFAARCREVTALEMDASSLCVCREQAEQLGLNNIRYQPDMWETFTHKQKFSFVFSAMCPAICNYSELQKMESCSNDACGIIAVTRGSYDLHRKKLMELLQVRPIGGMTTEALWYYEALYLAGRQPDIQNWSKKFEYTIPVADACLKNERYFEIFGIAAEVSRPILNNYFSSEAKDGMVYDETLLNTALITWRV